MILQKLQTILNTISHKLLWNFLNDIPQSATSLSVYLNQLYRFFSAVSQEINNFIAPLKKSPINKVSTFAYNICRWCDITITCNPLCWAFLQTIRMAAKIMLNIFVHVSIAYFGSGFWKKKSVRSIHFFWPVWYLFTGNTFFFGTKPLLMQLLDLWVFLIKHLTVKKKNLFFKFWSYSSTKKI